ncbi:MAG TPA: three-Cys-motif partner protein TcmP [Rhizomicrobium sp.]|jgi:three-Cys-motif partner protein|nr:three-Cys-motif partner protein TcmP [Rhizomicrobium sp.]
MVEKPYRWSSGATIEEHSLRKHKILREYFFKYLTVRCRLPQQERFRLAIVDGFAGGGRYSDGQPGSPVIFIEELMRATEAMTVQRAADGMSPISIDCLLVLNDQSADAVASLKTHIEPLLGRIKEAVPNLSVRVQYLNKRFEKAYPKIKTTLTEDRFRNVIFNLDQCGHSHVDRNTLIDIMRSFNSAEIFYTFAIQSLISFLQKANPELLEAQLAKVRTTKEDFQKLQVAVNRQAWLGIAERVVFEAFRTCAPFVSPFSIHNPDGWRYWLIHFANSYRARQVYNDTLHSNSSAQAHFGRSGLNMLSYDPTHEAGALYLFDTLGRQNAKQQLLEDIPRVVAESGDAIGVGDFYEGIYNLTPAHTDDIHSAIMENPDLEVITPSGGERRKANTITIEDVIKLRSQKSFFPVFNSGVSSKKPK